MVAETPRAKAKLAERISAYDDSTTSRFQQFHGSTQVATKSDRTTTTMSRRECRLVIDVCVTLTGHVWHATRQLAGTADISLSTRTPTHRRLLNQRTRWTGQAYHPGLRKAATTNGHPCGTTPHRGEAATSGNACPSNCSGHHSRTTTTTSGRTCPSCGTTSHRGQAAIAAAEHYMYNIND